MMKTGLLRRSQLCRLLQIVTALQTDRRPNARQLAEECEVSRRTIFRDLDAIEAAGLAIEYDAARQGFRLSPTDQVEPAGLDEQEVVILTILANQPGACEAFGLSASARSGVDKLILRLPPPSRRRVEAIDRATRPGPAGPRDECRRSVCLALLESLAGRVRVRLTCRDPGEGRPSTTAVEPERLVLGPLGWSLIARSPGVARSIAIPVGSIYGVDLTNEIADERPRPRLGPLPEEAGPGGLEVVLLRGVGDDGDLDDLPPGAGPARLTTRGDRRSEVRFTSRRPDELVGWVLARCGAWEVIAPGSLRSLVREAAGRVAFLHRRSAGPREDFRVAGG